MTEKKLLSKKEVMVLLHLKTTRAVDALCRNNGLPYKALPGGRYFVEAEIWAWIDARSFNVLHSPQGSGERA